MTFSIATIRAVEKLLKKGEVAQTALAELRAGYELGLWSPSQDGGRAVATTALVNLAEALPADEETVAAVFACEPVLRAAWQRIVAGRLKELGARRDAAGLCQAIDILGAASNALLAALPEASLAPSGYGELEMALFGAPVEQSVVTPKLLRVMGASAPFIEGRQAGQPSMLEDIDARNPEVNWVRGRLLRLPDAEETAPDAHATILSGSLQPLSAEMAKQAGNEDEATMLWVLARPWPFLLAQIVFTQEAWAAERISGGMALELEESQKDRFRRPPQIRVVITLANGYEIMCGSLGELILRILNGLGVSLFAARVTAGQLDDRLALAVDELLARNVWRFSYGSERQRPGYQIHERFSDSCYRVLGSKYFYRMGSRVTGAIRNACERWAAEQLARASVSLTAEV